MTERKRKDPPKMTVSEALFKAWQRLKRTGDPEAMALRFGFSRVPFDNALNFGYVAKDEISKSINIFFKERLEAEKSDAESLMQLANAVEEITTEISE